MMIHDQALILGIVIKVLIEVMVIIYYISIMNKVHSEVLKKTKEMKFHSPHLMV